MKLLLTIHMKKNKIINKLDSQKEKLSDIEKRSMI